LEEDRAVLQQGTAAPKLGTTDHLPAIHQHLAADRLMKTGPGVERCRAGSRCQGSVNTQRL
jgi:hypothetical protein